MATQKFFDARSLYFAQQDQRRSNNKQAAESLISKAQNLARSTNWKETGQAIRALQQDWKKALPNHSLTRRNVLVSQPTGRVLAHKLRHCKMNGKRLTLCPKMIPTDCGNDLDSPHKYFLIARRPILTVCKHCVTSYLHRIMKTALNLDLS
jgi:hypothetical protein